MRLSGITSAPRWLSACTANRIVSLRTCVPGSRLLMPYSPFLFPCRVSPRSESSIPACSRFATIHGSTPLSKSVTRGPFSVHMATDLQLPFGVNRDVILPPQSRLHLSRISGLVEETDTVADQLVYPYRSDFNIISDPSPSERRLAKPDQVEMELTVECQS